MDETQTAIKIKISPLMDELKVVESPPGITIAEAIQKAGISMKDAVDILLDDEPVDAGTMLQQDCVITLLPRVQAG